MTILSCDTSTKVCSVAIHAEGRLLSSLETHLENSHAENLTMMIQEAARLAKVELRDINAFALAKGPGSYTGLRIGCSTLKGLCFTFDAPLIALSTLQVMAEGLYAFVEPNALIAPMIDARRDEVYAAIYDTLGKEVLAPTPVILEKGSFSELLAEQSILFVGNGAAKLPDFIQHPNAKFISNVAPLARNMGRLAYEAYHNQAFEDVAYFEPEYLKEFYTTAKVVG